MDKLFHYMVARKPAEICPVAEHVLHIGPARLTLNHPQTASVAGYMRADYLSYRPVCHPAPGLDKILLNTPDGAAHHTKALLLCSFYRDHHFAGSNRVDSHRLLHENMLACIHGRFYMIGPESGRST